MTELINTMCEELGFVSGAPLDAKACITIFCICFGLIGVTSLIEMFFSNAHRIVKY